MIYAVAAKNSLNVISLDCRTTSEEQEISKRFFEGLNRFTLPFNFNLFLDAYPIHNIDLETFFDLYNNRDLEINQVNMNSLTNFLGMSPIEIKNTSKILLSHEDELTDLPLVPPTPLYVAMWFSKIMNQDGTTFNWKKNIVKSESLDDLPIPTAETVNLVIIEGSGNCSTASFSKFRHSIDSGSFKLDDYSLNKVDWFENNFPANDSDGLKYIEFDPDSAITKYAVLWKDIDNGLPVRFVKTSSYPINYLDGLQISYNTSEMLDDIVDFKVFKNAFLSKLIEVSKNDEDKILNFLKDPSSLLNKDQIASSVRKLIGIKGGHLKVNVLNNDWIELKWYDIANIADIPNHEECATLLDQISNRTELLGLTTSTKGISSFAIKAKV